MQIKIIFHRIFFYSIFFVSLLWGLWALKENPIRLYYDHDFLALLKLTYFLGFTVIFWPLFYLEIFDLFCSAQGVNGPVYKNFYNSIKKELIVNFIVAILIAGLYYFSDVNFSNTSLDIGLFSLPFFVTAIVNTFQILILGKKKTGKMIFPFIVQLFLVTLFCTAAYLYLIDSASGRFAIYQAVWFQTTVFFAGFFAFTSVSLQLSFLQQNILVKSRFKVFFFKKVINSKLNIY